MMDSFFCKLLNYYDINAQPLCYKNQNPSNLWNPSASRKKRPKLENPTASQYSYM